MAKTKTAKSRSKSDPEILALARVTKYAQAILEEYEAVGDDGAGRIREYIMARLSIAVSVGNIAA